MYYNVSNMGLSNIVIIFIITLSGSANLFLAVYAYAKNPKERINRDFFYFGLLVSLWCFTNVIDLIIRNLFWLRATVAIGFFIPLGGIFFAHALVGKTMNKLIKILLIVLGIIVFLTNLFTPLLIESLISFTDFGFEVVFGPLLGIWSALEISFILASFYIPLSFIRTTDEQQKRRIFFFLVGAAIFAIWFLVVSVALPILGYSQFSELDSPASIFLVGFTGYSIIKYNLMNISSLFFIAITYSAVIISIVAFLLLLLFISSFFFSHLMVWPIYALVMLVSLVLFFIGRLFFMEKKDLEQAKISLTELLKKSESDRVRAEAERDKTAAIVSSFSDGLILLDYKDNIFSINPAAEELLGLKEKEFIGKPLKSIIPSVKITKARAIMSVFGDGLKAIYRQPVKLADNLITEISVIMLTSAGKDMGHLIILHDITREKMVEKMKTDFVSLAAHQLRTPLSIIKWSISMLTKGDFGKLNKKQDEVVRNTFQSNERLISLVNNLLNVTRMEDGRYLYKRAKADMREIISAVLNTNKDEFEKRGIIIEYKRPVDFPEIMIDSEKIKIVIQNLVDNATKYSPRARKIKINLQKEDNGIRFEIRDFGVGIPEQQQGKIFQKFFRADNAVTMNTIGTGLGLFLSKNIIEAHGGSIGFKSEENKGTAFYFSLPIK